MQRLLSRTVWDEDAVPDAVRRYVIGHLTGPDAVLVLVLVLDETGQEKKGVATCGVGRQYITNRSRAGKGSDAPAAA